VNVNGELELVAVAPGNETLAIETLSLATQVNVSVLVC